MSMGQKKFHELFLKAFIFFVIGISFSVRLNAETTHLNSKIGNFGLPGIIDLPTGKKLPDGELVITQQLHEYLARARFIFPIIIKYRSYISL